MTDSLKEWLSGFRQLSRNPGFSASVVFTLALAMGVTSAMMSVGDALLLKPLPYHKPGELFDVSETSARSSGVTSLPNALDWKEQSRTLKPVAYYMETALPLDLGSGTTIVPVVKGSYEMFETLGVTPAVGRVFDPRDEREPEKNVAVLSAAFWRETYGEDRSVIGKTIRLNHSSYTIIGITPAEFAFPIGYPTAIWTPLAPERDLKENRGARNLSVIGRSHPGETLKSVEAEFAVLSRRLSEQYPDAQQGWTTRVRSYDDLARGHLRPMVLALVGALGVVFLIACANVTGLLLARVSARRREFTIKAALGASMLRIVRQILIECVLLSLIGAGFGALFTLIILTIFQPHLGIHVREAGEVAMNWRVGLFVLVQAIACGSLTAILPALALARETSQSGLREEALTVLSSRRQNRLMKVLASSQVALTFVLLVAAGLMLRTLDRLQHTNTGFEPDNVLTAELWPSLEPAAGDALSETSGRGDLVRDAYLPLVAHLGSLPEVQAAGLISVLPLSGFSGTRFFVAGRPKPSSAETPRCEIRAVSEGYFRALGIQLLAGRLPGAQDGGRTSPVAVINDVLARKYFPDDDALGKQVKLRFEGPNKESITIVGVFRATVQRSLSDPPEPELDLPYSQLTPDHLLYPYLGAVKTNVVLRTAVPPERVAPSLRRAVYKEAPDLAIDNVRSLADHMRRTLTGRQFSLFLIATFALLALAMALAGLHAVIALWVSQRTRELGLRMALGAPRSNVVGLVVRQTGFVVIAGLIAGWGLFAPLSHLVGDFLQGVAVTDTLTIAAVSLSILLIGLLAGFRPAWRAASILPNDVLRSE